jgi:glycosyltransferase involved in cell wall biosynthesis
MTPTYNHEKYIGECIQSVLNQTFQDWEMIIVDDGSVDRTAEIIREYDDRRIKYFRQDHVGPWKLDQTYNFALSKSSGEYIAYLEGDDYWPKEKLQLQYDSMENNPAFIMCYGESRMVSESKKEIGYFYLPIQMSIITNEPIGSSLTSFFDLQLFIPAVTVLIKRSALESIGGFQYSQWVPAVDYPTWLRLCLEGPFLPIKNHNLGYWRRHKGSISIDYQLEAWKGMAAHNIYFLERYQREINKLGFNFNKMEVQEKLNVRLEKIAKTMSYEMGLLYLSLNQYKLSRRLLLNYLLNKPNYREKGFVYLGLISSFVKVDLVSQYRKIRDGIKKWIRKKKMAMGGVGSHIKSSQTH